MMRKLLLFLFVGMFVFFMGAEDWTRESVICNTLSVATSTTMQSGSHLVVPLDNDASTPTFAFGDGDSGLHEFTDDALRFTVGAADRFVLEGNWFFGVPGGSGAGISTEIASTTNPTVVSNVQDFTTGMGGTAGTVSLISDAEESARVDDDTTAGNTRFLLYDVDNGQVERVSVGIADSGGAGFKVLRIPN
jgi:hypothetical protein